MMQVEAKEPAAAPAAETAGGLPRLLCVDDEPNVLQALQRQLHQRFSVAAAVGAAAGIEAVKDHGPLRWSCPTSGCRRWMAWRSCAA